jgi:SNF2 family DNA or RNA helicase
MALKTYGKIITVKDQFKITEAQPHVCIKLKSIFPKISRTATVPFTFKNTPEFCSDILWFMERYPLQVDDDTKSLLVDGKSSYVNRINELEAIFTPGYVIPDVKLKDGYTARDYQVKGSEIHIKSKRLLLGDDLGLGKTLTSILSLQHTDTLPTCVVVQTHLPTQWKVDGVEKFTNLKVHIIKKTKPYDLPPADVYIFKYSCLAGWIDFFQTQFFRSVIFDECQELRRKESQRYQAAKVLSLNAEYCIGLSATPIYNYGDEIYNVLDVINPSCLGPIEPFLREWATPYGTGKYVINDPPALGTYLRENFLFLRRTKKDVQMELDPVNKIIHTVGFDHKEMEKNDQIAKSLAMRIMEGSFVERGQAAREFDLLLRKITGVSKARYVAEYVKILLENNIPVILAGWHRDVYDIWLEELKEYKPVMYTGTESGTQKESAKQAFMDGKTNLLIISLRSGAGVDGLQLRCSDIVFGELDWSPKVHEQLIGRVDRPGQVDQVTAHFLVSEAGSDPTILTLLGLKSSQSHGITDPLEQAGEQYSDESRIKTLAKEYLNKKYLHKEE